MLTHLRFYTAADKTGGEYTTGVTTAGTAGSTGLTRKSLWLHLLQRFFINALYTLEWVVKLIQTQLLDQVILMGQFNQQ